MLSFCMAKFLVKDMLTSIIMLTFALFLFQIGNAFAEQNITCQSHDVCVHPGDHLKYQIHLGVVNSSQTYHFGDMIDNDNINVIEQYNIDQNKTENNTLILNLKTGFVRVQQNSTTAPFLAILPTPIEYNKTSTTVSTQLVEFNGFKRTALVTIQTSVNGSLRVQYDTQTGILLNEHFVGITNLLGRPVIVESSNNLVETNIINSDSSDTAISNSSISIPNWVKNNARWWAEGSMDDSEFVKGIQYLISNGIMQVPHDSSPSGTSQPIPSWIKSNAGWWAEGKISDSDFVAGIQYLISVGIIRV
ncbi:MAG: hypothetical protein AUG16_04975 [Thaumarchaeota archaeon 13_1_20CM_2_39_20]|nr:MAG: hypothetical protein AUG16_04975 [Thaumarchaeota archaeon 13_1_20CM_2_39_20]